MCVKIPRHNGVNITKNESLSTYRPNYIYAHTHTHVCRYCIGIEHLLPSSALATPIMLTLKFCSHTNLPITSKLAQVKLASPDIFNLSKLTTKIYSHLNSHHGQVNWLFLDIFCKKRRPLRTRGCFIMTEYFTM